MESTATAERDLRVVRIAAPLRHSVTESIRNAITVGRFKAEMTGVSRTLVREALREQAAE
jgi:DNA-binding GntR family transcriptional regulator